MNKTPCFSPAHILLPSEQIPVGQWGCVACDQFTSDRSYWEKAAQAAAGGPSTLDLILPEVYLEEDDVDARISAIHAAMDDYTRNVLTRAVDGFIYVERTEQSGRVRQGLVGRIDLEAYSYAEGAVPAIRPSEHTVESRIPPRMAVRRGARLETPHIMMLADDPGCTLIEPIGEKKEQLRKVCHISKRTAHYLLQFNLIPHVCTGKKTRCYAIKKRDVIDFMINREINPSRYIVPTSWYKYGNEEVKPYKIRIQPPLPNDSQKTRRYYESKLADYPDVIDVAAVVDFTGYNHHTVCEWIRFGKLRALALQHKYMIPKCYLIDWLSSEEHNTTTRKSRRHIDRLWELQKLSDGQ